MANVCILPKGGVVSLGSSVRVVAATPLENKLVRLLGLEDIQKIKISNNLLIIQRKKNHMDMSSRPDTGNNIKASICRWRNSSPPEKKLDGKLL